MNKLTSDDCKAFIATMRVQKSHGILSIAGEYHLQAMEIALPVLEQGDGWISCSDRMPRHRQSVLGWQEKPGTVIECYPEGIKWYYDYSDGPCGNITHWQPLPAPPQPTTDTYRQIENDGGQKCWHKHD
jgi:hypothetical protein